MVLLPLKSISTQSGNPAVASAQPPPLPQLTPARSLLLIDATGKDGERVLDAEATPPLLATMLCVPALKVLVTQAAVRVFPAPASTSAPQPLTVLPPSVKFTLP